MQTWKVIVMNEKITKPSRVKNVYLKEDLLNVIDFVKTKYSTEHVKLNDPEALRIIIRYYKDNAMVQQPTTDNVV